MVGDLLLGSGVGGRWASVVLVVVVVKNSNNSAGVWDDTSSQCSLGLNPSPLATPAQSFAAIDKPQKKPRQNSSIEERKKKTYQNHAEDNSTVQP